MKRNSNAPLKALSILCWLIIGYIMVGLPLPLPMAEEPGTMMMALTPKGESRMFQSTRFQAGNKVKITLTEYVLVNRKDLAISTLRYVQLSYSWNGKTATEFQTSQRRSKHRRQAWAWRLFHFHKTLLKL